MRVFGNTSPGRRGMSTRGSRILRCRPRFQKKALLFIQPEVFQLRLSPAVGDFFFESEETAAGQKKAVETPAVQ